MLTIKVDLATLPTPTQA